MAWVALPIGRAVLNGAECCSVARMPTLPVVLVLGIRRAAIAPAMNSPIIRSGRIASHSITNTCDTEVRPDPGNSRRQNDPSPLIDMSTANWRPLRNRYPPSANEAYEHDGDAAPKPAAGARLDSKPRGYGLFAGCAGM